MPAILVVNLVTSLLLTGLIWTIQLVHYPLFAAVGEAGFGDYVRRHGSRISVLVVPLMTVELAAAVWLVVALGRPGACPGLCDWVTGWAAWLGLALVGVIWLVTAAVFAPVHGRLARGRSGRDLELLVSANWVRTVAWTARSALLVRALSRGGVGR
ncbi:MAG: hypothetical protein ABIQ49_00065 [Gemmatimonadales bacterium]